MTRTVTAREANQHFSKLLASAEAGEETIIVKRGQAVAKLVPIHADTSAEERARRLAEFDLVLAQIDQRSVHAGGYRFQRAHAYEEG